MRIRIPFLRDVEVSECEIFFGVGPIRNNGIYMRLVPNHTAQFRFRSLERDFICQAYKTKKEWIFSHLVHANESSSDSGCPYCGKPNEKFSICEKLNQFGSHIFFSLTKHPGVRLRCALRMKPL